MYCQSIVHVFEVVLSAVPDEGVDLDTVHIVLLLEGLLDLPLVGPGGDDEDKGVVLLDLLHGGLGVERVQEDLVLVDGEALRWDRLARVLWRARQLKSLWAVEGGREPDLLDLVRVDLLERPSAVHSWGKKRELTRLKEG